MREVPPSCVIMPQSMSFRFCPSISFPTTKRAFISWLLNLSRCLNDAGDIDVKAKSLPKCSACLTEEQKHDLATNSTIDDMIIANIRRARFVIADLSCFPGEKMTSEIYKRSDGTAETRDIVCAGAYFEAGYATALEKPIIYLVHRKQTPHFDVNHIPYLTWDENALGDLEVALQNGIEARGLSAS